MSVPVFVADKACPGSNIAYPGILQKLKVVSFLEN
jgi:hypothetical protein